MVNISVVSPSVRPEMLPMIGKCLQRQSFKKFEWLVVSPQDLFISIDREIGHDYDFSFVPEPPKREGDYYGLCKAWNAGFKMAQGEFVLSIQDGLWFPPDMLEKFWNHYQANKKSIISAVGDQYDQIDNGKPEHCMWSDPRKRTDLGSFYEVEPTEIEFCIASLPKQALIDVGGIDEEGDKYAALFEKEMVYRMQKAGYSCYLDQGIEYRAIHHPRLNEKWEERYQAGIPYYQKCLREIIEGKRLKLSYLYEV